MRARPRKRIPLAVIGAGRAGLGLAVSLDRSGYRVTAVVARGRSSARKASRLLGRSVGTTRHERALEAAEVILLCVPDEQIGGVVETLSVFPLRGKTLLHTSGASDASPLAPLRERGASTGCLHPLWSFPEPGARSISLSGVAFALDGDPAARRTARRMVEALGGRPFRVPPSRRPAYHLAASLMANGLVALLDQALDLASRSTGVSARAARAAFEPLVRAAIDNMARSGPRKGLTGPIARGDLTTVAWHLAALEKEDPDLRTLYLVLARRSVQMSLAEGRLEPARGEDLLRLLGAGRKTD